MANLGALQAITEFLVAWKNQDWQKVLDYCQISWVDASPDPMEELKILLGYKLVEIGMIDLIPVSDVASRGKIKIEYNIARGVSKKAEIEPMIICETAPLTPDIKGKWGVNPISIGI